MLLIWMGGRNPSITPRKRKLIEGILHDVLEDVRPTEKEMKTVTFYANELMGRLKKAVPRNVEILLAGSVARGTQVRGGSDIDVFLLFPKTTDERKMEFEGVRIAKSIVNRRRNESYIVKYAEHPYVRLLLNDVNVAADIVPAFKIKSADEMGSAVDRTQLHNEFVNTKLSKRQRDDVRLLKTFLNARNVYGAEARTEGFSGYLCELLVYHFGSFLGVLEGFAHAKVPIAVDPLAKGAEPQNLKELGKRFGGGLVVIDPTDRNRNVAANVSNESLARFILSARAFIREPAKRAFLGSGYSDVDARGKLAGLRKDLGVDIYLMSFKVADITEDILWQQLKRLGGRIEQLCVQNGFAPLLRLQNLSEKKAILAFFMNRAENRSARVQGPSAFMGEAAEAFMKSHSASAFMYMDGDRIISLEKSRFVTQKEVFRHALSKSNIKFPSYIGKGGTRLYVNDIPEDCAKMLHAALHERKLAAR